MISASIGLHNRVVCFELFSSEIRLTRANKTAFLVKLLYYLLMNQTEDKNLLLALGWYLSYEKNDRMYINLYLKEAGLCLSINCLHLIVKLLLSSLSMTKYEKENAHSIKD